MKGPQVDGLSEENLRKLYIDNPDATLASVGEILGCHQETVRRWMRRFDLPIRKRSGRKPIAPPELQSREWLAEQLRTKTNRDIAQELGVNDGVVSHWRRKLGLGEKGGRVEAVREALRKKYPNGRHGPDHPNWKGGRQIINGYVFVYAPDHPNARSNRIQEHRLVMEKKLGRYLESNEVVHHLDGDRQNNHPDNLVLKIRGEHVSDHFKASHEVLELRQRIAELEAENEKLKAEFE